MRRFVPTVIATIGVGMLWFSGMQFYYGQDLLGSDDLRSALGWIVFGSGLLLTGGGLIVTAAGLDRKRRTILAISLLAFGSTSFLLGLAIAHAPMFVFIGFPAVVFGAIIGLMAILQHPSSEPRRG